MPSGTEGTTNARQQQQQQLQLRPPVLGIQPKFVSSVEDLPHTHLSPSSVAAVVSPKATSEKRGRELPKGSLSADGHVVRAEVVEETAVDNSRQRDKRQ